MVGCDRREDVPGHRFRVDGASTQRALHEEPRSMRGAACVDLRAPSRTEPSWKEKLPNNPNLPDGGERHE